MKPEGTDLTMCIHYALCVFRYMFSILTLLILILFSFQTSQSSIVSANSFTDGDLEVRGGLSYLTGKKEPFSGIIKVWQQNFNQRK